MPDREVVVAGLGVVSPAGTAPDRFWETMACGHSRIGSIEHSGGRIGPLPAGTVPDDGWDGVLTGAERRRLDRTVQLGLAAASQATAAAGLDGLDLDPTRLGFVAGVGFGGITTLTDEHRLLLDDGPRRLSPFGVATVMPSALAAFAAIRFGVQGPVSTATSACASGTQALVEAARLIADGSADVVIAGGAEAPLAELPMASFARMKALAEPATDPEKASRPYDADRGGFVMGEGAGFLVLVDAATARRHGLPVLARLAGWAVTSDAHHITAPDPTGGGAVRCITAALGRAGRTPADVVHVNGHGTGTRLNDAAEAAALEAVFGPHGVPVTSAKGAIGHLMGAAGGVEAVLTVQAMRNQLVPPTANCDNPDPDLHLDVVTGAPRDIPSGPALTCSFAFGGQNAAVLFTPA